MEKIWIVRERVIWSENRPSDDTKAFATKELAKKAMLERWEEIRGFYTDDELEEEYISDKWGSFINNNDDVYDIWVEEIDVFNEEYGR